MDKDQPDLNHTMRMILIDWIIEVGSEYRCLPQTVQLAVNYIDRFLSTRPVKRSKLQLVGVGAMLSASKFEEIWPPSIDDFAFITDNSYPAEEIKEMERRILEELGFRLVSVTPNEFFKAYMLVVKRELAFKRNSDELLRKLTLNGLFLQEFCMQTEIYVRLLPSVVAAISLFLARRYEGLPGWTEDLELHTHMSKSYVVTQARQLDKSLREQKALRPAHRNYKAPLGTKGFCALFGKYTDQAAKKHFPTSWLLTRRRLPSWSEVAGKGGWGREAPIPSPSKPHRG